MIAIDTTIYITTKIDPNTPTATSCCDGEYITYDACPYDLMDPIINLEEEKQDKKIQKRNWRKQERIRCKKKSAWR